MVTIIDEKYVQVQEDATSSRYVEILYTYDDFDNLPTDVAAGSLAYELDTKYFCFFADGQWNEVGGGENSGGGSNENVPSIGDGAA